MLVSLKEILKIAEARKIIAQGENLVTYNPVDADKWEEAYKEFSTEVIHKGGAKA